MKDYFVPNVSRSHQYDGHALVESWYESGNTIKKQWTWHNNGVLVRSEVKPNTPCVQELPIFYPPVGQVLEFTLTTNPLKQKHRMIDGKRTRIIFNIFPDREAEISLWLYQRSFANGFVIDYLTVDKAELVPIVRKGKTFKRTRATYTGVLRVTDAQLFSKLLDTGLSTQKAFGFGLFITNAVS